jgi:membrane associated rhomboid family serine protease
MGSAASKAARDRRLPLWTVAALNGLCFVAWNAGFLLPTDHDRRWQRFEGQPASSLVQALPTAEAHERFMNRHFTVSVQNTFVERRYWTLLTSCLSHKDLNHILSNLTSFFLFAPRLLPLIGGRRLVLLYAASGVLSSLVLLGRLAYDSSARRRRLQWSVRGLGASGSVSALTVVCRHLLFRACCLPTNSCDLHFQAYCLLRPLDRFTFGDLQVPAVVFAAAFLLAEFFADRVRTDGRPSRAACRRSSLSVTNAALDRWNRSFGALGWCVGGCRVCPALEAIGGQTAAVLGAVGPSEPLPISAGRDVLDAAWRATPFASSLLLTLELAIAIAAAGQQ